MNRKVHQVNSVYKVTSLAIKRSKINSCNVLHLLNEAWMPVSVALLLLTPFHSSRVPHIQIHKHIRMDGILV